MAVLIAATSIVIGTVTIVSLHGYLVSQLDSRLSVASQRSLDTKGKLPPLVGTHGQLGGLPADPETPTSTPSPSPTSAPTPSPTSAPTPSPSSSSPGHDFIGAPGQSPNTVVAVVVNGRFAVNGFVDANGTRHTLSAASQAALRSVSTDGKPTTRDLGSGLGVYRLVATRLPDKTTVITGLPLASVNSITERLVLVVLIVTLGGLLVAALAAAFTVQRTLRPLRRVAGTASAVTELDLDRDDVPASMRVQAVDIGSASEVGQVGLALNRLLGNVSAALRARRGAESKMRTFVADASHELRTPLSTVRAYAELSRREYPDIPDGLRRNIERIESESVRMSLLVEELLLLARLDSEPKREQADVDLSRLLAETVSDAQAAAPDHGWILELPEEPLVIAGDEAQLRRMLVNLLANAHVHTPAGTRVSASIEREPDGSATIVIGDDGPGIPAELRPALFERFVRGDVSRSRGSGSTGLGLAIVEAVVQTHGGTVVVDSAPGRTTFRIHLPSGDGQAGFET